ncbi:oligopeptide transporter [Mollisia scopiformis]|uniref:Oligopeptide transporter n=1 Tax=Mollisia scopiformis TaxID=149040 RepID=A0A132B6V7_MOLSC|nr:oligopeptide transporter [Mollisia scopiformis]KUJ07407.1 oligopeptide transporter [Mollisia scopiformis]
MDRSFTLRALLAGLFLGVLVNLSNTYYGLRIGAGSQMSMVSGLLGFVGFKLFSKHTAVRFSAAENFLVISVATATGCMPITAGFVGIIPALEYLIGAEENGPLHLHWESLVLWSMGLCFFGLIFASLLREHFVVQERLPWPGPKANAHLINTLHRRSPRSSAPPGSSLASTVLVGPNGDEYFGPSAEEPLLPRENDFEWKLRMNSLFRGATVSGIITVFMYFVPIFHSLPILGLQAANKWLWTLDISPGFFGQGIITGPTIPLHMLFGAIVGWGILSPYAKHNGWAPGQIDDWETGSRGWIIWVSLAALLADASVKLAWFLVRPIWRQYLAGSNLQKPLNAVSKNVDQNSETQSHGGEFIAAPFEMQDDPLSPRVLALGFFCSVIVCTLVIHFIFGNIIPWYYTILAIAISLPMAIVGIRSLAKTDYNPKSALIFASLISRSNPNRIIINLLLAAVAQTRANQAGELTYDFKIESLVSARSDAQVYRQIIGSIFGALNSCGIYKLYASQYPILRTFFKILSSFLVFSTARLVIGRGLPDRVALFAIGAASLSILVTIIKIRYLTEWWQKLILSGVSFAIGIYNMLLFTFARAAGGVFFWAYQRRNKSRERNIIVLANELVLSESFASLISLALSALQVPQVGGG